jgi:octaprenyl-diphosphate synthase
MSEGEILQMRKSRKLDIDFDTYFEIIKKKTASLIATSMAMGAASVSEDDELVEKMFRIGQYVGIAFQIKDDIFDYQSKGVLGKPTGNDIKEKKITLPLLYVLDQSDKTEKRRILSLVKKKNKNAAKVKELVDLVVAKGGLEYAEQRMNEFRDKAIGQIKQLPENESRTALIELVNYTTTRKK